jgi:hypothetical protein
VNGDGTIQKVALYHDSSAFEGAATAPDPYAYDPGPGLPLLTGEETDAVGW